MLSHDETLKLIERAQNGDTDAKETLVKENVPLIKSIVKRFLGRNEYDDLMQLGAMGLLKAVSNFDTSFNVRFSTYAVPMISGEIKRFLRDDGSIKVSRWAKTLAAKIAAYIDGEQAKSGVEPSIENIAEHFGVEEQDVVFALDTSHYTLSLSEPLSEDDGATIGDKIVGDASPDENLDSIMLKDCIMNLPERERKIIYLRYFRDKTQTEVAIDLGVSQVQVSRIEAKILKDFKDRLDDK